MTIRPIILHPDPRLKKRCALITLFDAELKDLSNDMFETMYNAPGIGLAAPQIGIMSQIFVMDCGLKEEDPNPLIFINPTVSWSSEETFTHNEGCLSIPEQYEDVTRPAEVTITFQNLEGKPFEVPFEGIEATCVQHEIDHLNGKLFIDYLSGLKRRMITDKMKKLKREIDRK